MTLYFLERMWLPRVKPLWFSVYTYTLLWIHLGKPCALCSLLAYSKGVLSMLKYIN